MLITKSMDEKRSPAVSLRWPTVRWKKLLVAVVAVGLLAAATLMMVTQRMARELAVRRTVAGTDEATSQHFIPVSPDQVRIGEPAEIPRKFLVEEADACTRRGDNVEVVAYVHSAISRVEHRQQTRLTWANSTALDMVVVFMVGLAKDDKEREIVQRESELYHDIVQGDYGDHYHLLTYKALSSLYWVTRHCPHVPWTLHADDDVLLDTFVLRELLQPLSNSSDKHKIHCKMIRGRNVRRKGRWKVTKRERKENKYPPYCQGPIWFINTEQVPRLLLASLSVDFLWVDDAYITGILAKEANIKFLPIGRYIRPSTFDENELGKKLAWFHLNKRRRTSLWPIILNFHNATDEGNVP